MDDPDVAAPFGYPEAKWVCEQMLLQGAELHPTRFEPIIVRVGQLTGSTTAASWSPTEHLPSIFKSSQSLGALPDISGVRNIPLLHTPLLHTPLPNIPLLHLLLILLPQGLDVYITDQSPKTLSWIPVDIAATSLLEILFQPHTPTTSRIYHLENPTRQSWPSMLAALSRSLCQSTFTAKPSTSPPALSASSSDKDYTSSSTPSSPSESDHATTTTSADITGDTLPIIPFTTWLQKVREESDFDSNPAGRLMDFLEESFTQLSTGQLVLDTKEARKVSRSLREVGAVVDEALLRRYIDSWRADGVML